MGKIKAEAAFLFMLITAVAFAQSSPELPHIFWGDADADSTDLPSGSTIIAKVGGVEKGRITTTEAGKYGGPSASDGKLLVQDGIGDGATIEFYVSRVKANEAASYDSGEIENKNLTWDFPPVVEINESVVNESVTCIPDSVISAAVSGAVINISCANATSGTINNLSSLGTGFVAGTPGVGGFVNISTSYEISISGNVSIVVTIPYDDTGIDESTVTIYKFVGGSWVAIPSSDIISIDTVNNKITFKVSPGGTPYTSFGSPPATPAGAPAGGGGGGGGIAPALSLSIAAPDSISVQAGASGSFDAVVTATGNPAFTTTVSVSGLPAGFASSVSPGFINIPANGTGTFAVTISVPPSESPRTLTFAVNAVSGAVSSTRNVDLIVTPPPLPPNVTAPNVTAPTTPPTPPPAPPTGITGLITGLGTTVSNNPAVAAAVLIIAFAAWRMWKKGRKGVKPAK